jgi:ABC-type multidrug transport system fused ATPase/permease subunit
VSDSRLEASAPALESGSLNHTDFDPKPIMWSIRKSISMMPKEKRRLLRFATALQVSLGVLDLIGIALIGLVAAIAVSGIGTTGLPDFLQSALDTLGLGGLTVSQLSVIVALTAVFVLIAKSVLSALMTKRIMTFLANQQADLSINLASRFLSRPITEVQRWTTSEATYALGSGAAAATVALLGSAITIVSELFLFTIIGISLLIYDPIVTLAAGIFFAIVVLVMQKGLGSWSARNAEVIKTTSIQTLGAVSEALSTYREATVLNRRDLYVANFSGVVRRYAKSSATTAFVVELPKYILEVALYLGVLVLAVVQFLTRDWASAAATTALFLAAGSRVIPSLLRLQGAGITIRNASVMAQPTFLMFDQLTEAEQPQKIRLKENVAAIHSAARSGYPDFQASLVISNVSLTFSDASTHVLHDISLEVSPGKSLALVGSTGAGKSTLADVALGVLAPDSGTVLLGGLPPREAINTWPGAIAYVPQTVALISGSVRENVALGIPNDLIDDTLVWEALERAHLGDFLRDERDGLSTVVGERGFRLSGGQRQRLGIARALYTRPKLLILDEATSALDAETEQAIVETLQELEGQVTTITVAHRLVTVRHADELLYLDRGVISARGNFDQIRSESEDFDRQATLLGL